MHLAISTRRNSLDIYGMTSIVLHHVLVDNPAAHFQLIRHILCGMVSLWA